MSSTWRQKPYTAYIASRCGPRQDPHRRIERAAGGAMGGRAGGIRLWSRGAHASLDRGVAKLPRNRRANRPAATPPNVPSHNAELAQMHVFAQRVALLEQPHDPLRQRRDDRDLERQAQIADHRRKAKALMQQSLGALRQRMQTCEQRRGGSRRAKLLDLVRPPPRGCRAGHRRGRGCGSRRGSPEGDC